MTAIGRGQRRPHPFLRALGWASVAGVLCLWLTTSTPAYDGAVSSQVSVSAQVSAPVVLSVRQHVDLAMVLPEPAWFPLPGLLLVAVAMVAVVATARRPLQRHAPRAPPVASGL